VPQAERGQFSAVRRGPGAQLRRSEDGAELVDDHETPAAGPHQGAAITGGLRAQRLREPRGGP
jgi:hypothetical protein